MKKSNEISLGDAIQKFLKESGLEEKAQVKKVIHEWERIMGKPVAENTKNKWFNENTGIFYIEMSNPVWKSELNLARGRIRDILNRELGAERIKDVKIL